MALLEQDVPFFSELTPREIINFAAQLEEFASQTLRQTSLGGVQ